jgi:phosphoribosylformylglycinamidine synthase
VNVAVVVFPGSNCDRDMYHVLSDVYHLNAQYCWHDKPLPENIDAVVKHKVVGIGPNLGL